MIIASSEAGLVRPFLLQIVCAAVLVGDGLGAAVGEVVAVGDGEAVGAGAAEFDSDLANFQISFLPDLAQVYFAPLLLFTCPTLVHFAPALIVALWAGALVATNVKLSANPSARSGPLGINAYALD